MNLEYLDSTELESGEWSDSEWESELSEAPRRRPPARPGRYSQPPMRGYVTQTQFQTALDKVRADVSQNARAIASVGTQVDALSKRTRTEVKTLKDEHTKNRDETRNTLQMLAILPLLSAGGSTAVKNEAGESVKVATPPSSMMELLPLLLLSGSFGGTGGAGGSTSGGMDGMMFAVLLAAGGGFGSGK